MTIPLKDQDTVVIGAKATKPTSAERDDTKKTTCPSGTSSSTRSEEAGKSPQSKSVNS